jgi:NADH:ubiquinone oxidoreductase subunit
MVYGVIRTFQAALKYRGGWRGLLEHMYTNGDYPFKFGTYMGHDAAGNRYYENRVDYPFGQHRWVEPGDIHNFDSASIPPEWHGWMTSMNDAPPSSEESYISKRGEDIIPLDHSSVPSDGKSVVGHQETVMNFHHLHNLTTVRSRGWGIGNPIVGLPPGAKDSYYTQPGSPYNEGSIRPRVNIGDLDSAKGGGRPYKSEKWADRLRTKQEREEIEKEKMRIVRGAIEREKAMAARRKVVMAARGNGTVAGSA